MLTNLINCSLRLGVVTPFLKDGLITMVPKPQPDGSASSSAEKMRPITDLSTLLRITSRILNARIPDLVE